ncbi:hypothetical protein WKI68_28235 [Streptomyces sp. MS1.HAVA.3]|uniref:Secreted protein n=1 Tax=Streptomyces caledonius TaxID=3134107 RepID=A0ABU8U8E6_9ACTN
MRLRKALALTAVLSAALAAATAPTAGADIGAGGGRPAPALPSRAEATCGDGKSHAFPIGARIRGGPAVYRTGGEPQTWYLDLTNTTNSKCTAIHPVVVLTDKARTLRPAHLRMEFDAPGGTFPASLEHSDRDEIIAVFDGGDAFPGFTVGAGGSLTVRVGLAFSDDAPPARSSPTPPSSSARATTATGSARPAGTASPSSVRRIRLRRVRSPTPAPASGCTARAP